MSEFGKTSQETKKNTSRPKFSSDFIKTTAEHQTVVRVLDGKPEVSWSHYVPRGHHAFPLANAGKGMSFICLGWDKCPICAWNKDQKKHDPKTKDLLNARKVYTFNVLDRTPVVVCPSCKAEYYEVSGTYPAECECGADMSKTNPEPRNKIQVMQKGQRIIDQLESFEQEPELGDLKEYDIKFDTRGKGTESQTLCVPKQKTKIDLKKILGDDWQAHVFDCKAVVTPLEADAVKRILAGEDYYTVLGNKEVKV